jgi:hypothetical protein
MDLEQGERGPVRQHQPPGGRADARQGSACGAPPDAALFIGHPQWCEGDVQRWTDAIATRPAVKRGRMVNRISGGPASQCARDTRRVTSTPRRRTRSFQAHGADSRAFGSFELSVLRTETQSSQCGDPWNPLVTVTARAGRGRSTPLHVMFRQQLPGLAAVERLFLAPDKRIGTDVVD